MATIKDGKIYYKRVALTTKKALELLLSGELQSRVCRFCLYVTCGLRHLDQVMFLAGKKVDGIVYKISIRDMLAMAHPVKVIGEPEPNYPCKICDKCLNSTIRAYLFAQQCEQAERAFLNCLDDMNDKLDKLDPIEQQPKKRGRPKVKFNHNVLHTNHKFVIDYAEPAHHLVNHGSIATIDTTEINKLECKKCWQLLPDLESLAYHMRLHPKTMWYRCRLCAKPFARVNQYNEHLRKHHKINKLQSKLDINEVDFKCYKCGFLSSEFKIHLQHIEKHKFQTVLEHLVGKQDMDGLCTVCLNNPGKLEDLSKMISLHGGYPEMSGDHTLYNILGSTIPELNLSTSYIGTKICEKCIDLAISAYIFIYRTHFIRKRLYVCVTSMLHALNKSVESEGRLLMNIDQNTVLPINELAEYDGNLLLEPDEVNESKLAIEVLEDEYKLKDSNGSISHEQSSTKISKLSKGNIELINGLHNGDLCNQKISNNNVPKLQIKYTCPICYKHFVSMYFLKNHVSKHLDKSVQCKVCTKSFSNKFHQLEHLKTDHLSEKPTTSLSCSVCCRTFFNRHKMREHARNHVKKQCFLCSKTFKLECQYHSHIKRHAINLQTLTTSSKTYSCCFCNKTFISNNDLSVHNNKIHMETKPYNCDMCEKQFYTDYNMRQHKKIHSIKKKESCQLCDKTLNCRRDLVVHIRRHIGIKPFKCKICLWKFYTDTAAVAHLKKWHGLNYYKFKNRSVQKNYLLDIFM